MNILIIAPQPFYQQRGTPIAVHMLAKTLAGFGHTVHLLAYHEGEPIEMGEVALHRIPRLPGVRDIPPGPSWKKLPCDTALFFSAWRLISRHKIDLVHAVEEAAYLASALKTLRGIPYIYDMDSSLAEQILEKWSFLRFAKRLLEGLERFAIRRSAGVLAVCKALEDKALAAAPGKLVRCIEDVTLLSPVESGPCLKSELGIDGQIIMYVGNLESYQGIDLLVDAFAELDPAQRECAHLVVVGGTEAHIATYRKKIVSLGLIGRAHFVGPRPLDHLAWYLAQADILASPRIKGNNTPMKVYSYLDSGRPVLATRLPTHTQVMDDEIGLLVEPNAPAMARGIAQLLANAGLRQRLAERAAARVAELYSPEAYQRKLGEFYRQLQRDQLDLPRDESACNDAAAKRSPTNP